MRREKSTLLVVACHAVFRQGCTTPDKVELDSSREGGFPGEGGMYRDHAKAGVLRATRIPGAILCFSGGETQPALPGRSEGCSYWEVAEDHGWWDQPEVETRASYESYARDSFENLLYSIALHRRDTGNWPERVVVIGWAFKESRFDLHRAAIKWPREKFEYCGVNNPEGAALAKAIANESALLTAVERDPYLREGEFVSKRELRNPFRRRHDYRGIDAQLDRFFDFLESSQPTDGPPWS